MPRLSRLIHNFDAVHTGHPSNGHEGKQDLPLRIGSNPGEVPIDGAALSASLFHDVEASQQGDAVTVNVKETTAEFGGTSVAFPVVPFAELQRDSIPSVRHRDGVREMSSALASGVRQADQRLSRAARARLTFSRMSEALAVHTNGLGLSLCLSM